MDTTFLSDAVATLRCVARNLDQPNHRLPQVLQDQLVEAMEQVQQCAATVGEILVDIEVWNRQQQ